MKIFKKIILPLMLVCIMLFALVGCVNESDVDSLKSQLEQLQQELDSLKDDKAAANDSIAQLEEKLEQLKQDKSAADEQIEQLEAEIALLKAGKTTADKSYDKIKYIDANLHDRDCISGEDFEATQNWIIETALAAGYTEEEIVSQEFSFTRRQVEYTSHNIVITKTGKSEKQIIVGAHYDGDGTGDNGSGIALALTTAEELVSVETSYTIVFVFFSAEEYGCYGSTAYANAMSETEVENTLYMINLDSLVCGDYCYLYGGVANKSAKTVTETEAFDNAMAIAKSLGLEFRSNPWTWDNPAPGYEEPDYPSPTTGDWSDHKGFKSKGIKYLYMEATNWEIPGPYNEYDGYGETELVGMLMNTKNDYLEYIETYFPGRIQHHLSQFAPLLRALLVQPKVDF